MPRSEVSFRHAHASWQRGTSRNQLEMGCEQQAVATHGEASLSSPGSSDFIPGHEMFPSWFFTPNVSGTNSWKAVPHWENELYSHVVYYLPFLKQ